MPFVAVTLVTMVLAHELPPGVVERAIQVTARPAAIEVFYQFGLNEQTMRSELEKAGQIPAADLAALEQQYLAHIAPLVSEQLVIELDGRPVRDLPAAAEMIYLHHLQFQCRFRIPWTPEQRETRLRIIDQNFPSLPGHFRLAVRGRAGIEALSAEAPILVRAPRIAIEGARPGAQQQPTIEATLVAPLADNQEPNAARAQGQPSGEDAVVRQKPQQPSRPPPNLPGRRVPMTLLVLLLLVLAAFTVPFLLATSRSSR